MGPRPVGVTIVGIVIVIAGILGLVVSILGFFSGDTAGWGIAVLLLGLVISIVYLLVAKGIFNGNRMSRLIVAIFTVLGLITGVIALFYGTFGAGIVQILWCVLILALLYAGRAKEFFSA
jgi:hypothetical protein